MKIVIETIPHHKQRYPTAGDWIYDSQCLRIYVSDLGDPYMEALVGIHEMIEALLCERRDIDELTVSGFDKDHPDLDDPGASPAAPYHREHIFAENLERLLAAELGVNWAEYDRKVSAL